MNFCEITSNTIIKTCAKFHFVTNLIQVVMTVDLTMSSKMSFIKVGFILFSVLNISIKRLLSLVTFIVLLPPNFRIYSYEDNNYHIENEKLFYAKTQPYSIPNPIRSATMSRWVRGGDIIFVKKRYGITRVGGFLFSVRVELPLFTPYAF